MSLNHPTDVHSLEFSRDGKLIAAGCADEAVRLWDAQKTDSYVSTSVKMISIVCLILVKKQRRGTWSLLYEKDSNVLGPFFSQELVVRPWKLCSIVLRRAVYQQRCNNSVVITALEKMPRVWLVPRVTKSKRIHDSALEERVLQFSFFIPFFYSFLLYNICSISNRNHNLIKKPTRARPSFGAAHQHRPSKRHLFFREPGPFWPFADQKYVDGP